MSKKRILVVDDEPNLSHLVQMFLTRTDRYEVVVENRPSMAVKTALSFRPHLIILDVDMPGKDGGEVNRELKEKSELANVPTMFLTSLISTAEAGQKAALRGGVPFLAKPLNPTVLVREVDRLLAGETSRAA